MDELMDALSPNAAQIVNAMFSIIDADKIGSLSHEVLVRELRAIAARSVNSKCPHISEERKVEVESQVVLYLETTEREELIATIEDWPKLQQPLTRSLIWWVSFCVFGAAGILLLPVRWLSMMIDWIWPPKIFDQEICHYESLHQSLCKLSDVMSYKLWPERQVACFCCNIDASLSEVN